MQLRSFRLLPRNRIAGSKEIVLLSIPDTSLEIATSMGSMPGTTICGLADGNNWAIRTIMNKYWSEFERRVKPTFVAVKVSVGAR